MAKAAPPKTTEPTRIRFVYLEAELPAGSDLGQIAHAMQSALKPSVVTVPVTRAPAAQRLNGPAPNGNDETLEPATDEVVTEADAEVEEVARAPRPTRKAKVKTPKVLDLDLTSDPPFANFAEQKNPKSHSKRYLVVAAWFKEHRNLDAITPDHVYTCYRHVKWPANVSDFAQPFRNLKHQQLFDEGEDGFAINHLGLQQVDELTNA